VELKVSGAGRLFFLFATLSRAVLPLRHATTRLFCSVLSCSVLSCFVLSYPVLVLKADVDLLMLAGTALFLSARAAGHCADRLHPSRAAGAWLGWQSLRFSMEPSGQLRSHVLRARPARKIWKSSKKGGPDRCSNTAIC
jgi:hypothetical protein